MNITLGIVIALSLASTAYALVFIRESFAIAKLKATVRTLISGQPLLESAVKNDPSRFLLLSPPQEAKAAYVALAERYGSLYRHMIGLAIVSGALFLVVNLIGFMTDNYDNVVAIDLLFACVIVLVLRVGGKIERFRNAVLETPSTVVEAVAA